MDSLFIAKMENVLDYYKKDYNPKKPLLCFDERPCQLIENILTPIPPSSGKEKKEDYHYKRNGTCAVLLAVEPKTGKRIVEVSKTRTKKDYAGFMKKVMKEYKSAEEITLVQDNLNTHNASSFYENFSPDKAFNIMKKFDMVYTPKKASWLNMAEIEFSALSKQCLDRRIGDIETMTKEIASWAKKRNEGRVKINWQFTKEKARSKFKNRYLCTNN